MIGFSFIYYLSMTVLWIIVLVQFLFVLITDKRSSNVTKVSRGFRNYMIQILPGAMAFTLMPDLASSKAILFVSCTSPALAAA